MLFVVASARAFGLEVPVLNAKRVKKNKNLLENRDTLVSAPAAGRGTFGG